MSVDSQLLDSDLNKAYGIALLCFEGMGPARLEKLSSFGNFTDIWNSINSKNPKEIAQIAEVKIDLAISWNKEVNNLNPAQICERHSNLEVLFKGEADYPKQLVSDLEPPLILFFKGAYSLNEILSNRPVVGIVGTRNCSRYGADISYELGMELSKAGVVVVSGLAYGIDTAAHSGSVQAIRNNPDASPPIGVIASGLDIIYPKRAESLYRGVFKTGVIISETPLGFPPKKWRFPARNRIIAGLSDLVIVVESHLKGGSLITAEEAGLRGKTVMAVPGSIRSPASSGTNALIADGCQPLTNISDVFLALDMNKNTNSDKSSSLQIELDHNEKLLLDTFCWEVHNLETLLQNTNMEFPELSIALESLIKKNLVVKRGLNFERISTNA